MKTPTEVRLLGPSLLCRAVEALLASAGPIEGEGGDVPVLVLIGAGWQNRVSAEERAPRRSSGTGAAAAGAPARYVLIGDGAEIDFYAARKRAVNAFVGSDEPVSVLIEGIRAAAANRLYCSPQLLPALIEAVGGDSPAKPEPPASDADKGGAVAAQAALLSAREHEVALHAARGLSNEQIAVFLGISVPTVKFHLMHAFRKLDIQRRTQLYAFMPFFTSATEALLPK